MPEENNQTSTQQAEPVQQTDGSNQQAKLIAGKFKDEQALDSAIQQLANHEKINLPGLADAKFESIDKKVEVYQGIESLLHRSAPKADALQVGAEPNQSEQAAAPQPMSMQDLVAGVGVEQDAINQAVMQGGKLPAEVLQKFGQAKIMLPDGTTGTLSPELVGQVLGAQAQAAASQQQSIQAAAQHVGGQDKLNALLQFGGTLDPVTQQSINLELGSAATMRSGLDRLNGLYAKSINAEGSTGIVSNTQGTTDVLANKPFKSRQEINDFRKEHGDSSEIYKSRMLATPDSVINTVA